MWGSIISSIGGLAGSLFGNKSAERAQRKAQKHAEYLDNTKIQRTVKDAKAAGIHPLAALGANLSTPQTFMGSGSTLGDAIGAGAAAIGSAVDNAAARKASASANALNEELIRAKIATERAQAANLLSEATSRSQIASARRAALGGPHTSTPVSLGAGVVPGRPGWSDAQEVEDRYGGIIGELHGLAAGINDLVIDPAKKWFAGK